MTITYTWEITGLKTQNVNTDKQNAVVQTYWKKIGTDENGNKGVFSGGTPFTVDPNDDSGPFIPFEQLTEEDVINWIKTVVVGEFEKHVNEQIRKQIDLMINPIVEKNLPWKPQTEPELKSPDAPL